MAYIDIAAEPIIISVPSYLSRLSPEGPRDAIGEGDGDNLHRPGTPAPHGKEESIQPHLLPILPLCRFSIQKKF